MSYPVPEEGGPDVDPGWFEDDDDDWGDDLPWADFPADCGDPSCGVCHEWRSVYGEDNSYL